MSDASPAPDKRLTVGSQPALRDAVSRRLLADPDVAREPANRSALRRGVARALAAEGVVLSPGRWSQLVRDLVDDLGGLGPAESLLRDPEVTDVLINGPGEVWVDRAGQLERTEVCFPDVDHLERMVHRVLGPIGARLDRSHPWADAALPGGLRLHVVIPPLVSEPVVTIRRIARIVPSWDDLQRAGSLTAQARELLVEAVGRRHNIVICGRAGCGKTTLLARLLDEVDRERVVVIEEAPELDRPSSHAVTLRSHPPSPDGAGGVDLTDLLRNALRMRPDRIVVGEVRGHEVAEMLQAMNTGHHGSMTTVHANGAVDALVRLEGMALLAGVPLAAARAQVVSALDLIVAMERTEGQRRVAAIAEVTATADGRAAIEQVWP